MDCQEEYIQCNEHLRETDRKRDQVIIFYTAVIAAYLTLWDRLQSNFHYVVYSLGILSLILCVHIIFYRYWHIAYVNTAALFQLLDRDKNNFKSIDDDKSILASIISNQKGLTGEILFSEWTQDKKDWLYSYFISTEFFTFLSFTIISYLPIFNSFKILIPNISKGWLIISFILYELIMNIIAFFVLSWRIKTHPWADWMIIGLDASKKIGEPQPVNEK